MSLSWDAVVAHVLSLPDTILTTYYGDVAVKANDRPVVTPGNEPGSFCLHIDRERVAMLMDLDPGTFWQTPHYAGYAAMLVRYDAADPGFVFDRIEAARDWAMLRPKPKPRTK